MPDAPPLAEEPEELSIISIEMTDYVADSVVDVEMADITMVDAVRFILTHFSCKLTRY